MPNDQSTRRFRLRFSLRQLFLAVAVVGVGMGIWNWLTRKVVLVRAATPEDEVRVRRGYTNRNVVVATGRFVNEMRLYTTLFTVRGGVVDDVAETVLGRSAWEREATVGSIWKTMTFRLALSEKVVQGGRMTDLDIDVTEDIEDINGYGSKNQNKLLHNINVIAKQALPGTITPGRPHIVYVEGDQQINVDGNMTVEAFAKVNPGNYIVVTVELR